MNLNVYVVGDRIQSVFNHERQPKGVLIAQIPCNRFKGFLNSRTLKQLVSKLFRRFLSDFDDKFNSRTNLTDDVLRYYAATGILYPNWWTQEFTAILAKKHANLERYVAITQA